MTLSLASAVCCSVQFNYMVGKYRGIQSPFLHIRDPLQIRAPLAQQSPSLALLHNRVLSPPGLPYNNSEHGTVQEAD